MTKLSERFSSEVMGNFGNCSALKHEGFNLASATSTGPLGSSRAAKREDEEARRNLSGAVYTPSGFVCADDAMMPCVVHLPAAKGVKFDFSLILESLTCKSNNY